MALAFGLDVVVWQPEGAQEAEGWDGTDSDYAGSDARGVHSVRDQDVRVDPLVFGRLVDRAAELLADRRRERAGGGGGVAAPPQLARVT